MFLDLSSFLHTLYGRKNKTDLLLVYIAERYFAILRFTLASLKSADVVVKILLKALLGTFVDGYDTTLIRSEVKIQHSDVCRDRGAPSVKTLKQQFRGFRRIQTIYRHNSTVHIPIFLIWQDRSRADGHDRYTGDVRLRVRPGDWAEILGSE